MTFAKQNFTTDDARDALMAIPADLGRDDWHRVGCSAIAAGLCIDDIDRWSASVGNLKRNGKRVYEGTKSVHACFAPISPDGGARAETLFWFARQYGWKPKAEDTQRPAEPPRPPDQNIAEVWNRLPPATRPHPYALRKKLCTETIARLRVVPDNDPLAQNRGWLAVPGYSIEGLMTMIEFVAPDGTKRSLKGSTKAGAMFTVGPTAGPATIVEGLGAADSVYASNGSRAIGAFGAGNIRAVVEALRQKEPDAPICIAPDRGKEQDAHKIAAEFNCSVACIPEDEPNNTDLNDIFCRDGFDMVQALLDAAAEPPKPEPRYKLLNRDDLAALPALSWRVRGVLPAVGLAGLYGPSASGKSFLAFDMSAAIADGERWFDCRVEAAPVVYAALEGEAGFKLRAQAWELHQGRMLPDGLQMILQPFKLTDPRDVTDLAAVVPAGAVVFIDTLNRAAPTADENSSSDMGEILQAAKRLQALTAGLVVLVHHTGKDTTKGLRGHSSLFAAMDAAIEVSRDGDRREWRCAKSKDGADGDAHPFKLEVKTLGMDSYNDPITSCVVCTDTTAADIQRVKMPQGGNQRLVYEGIRTLFKDGHAGKPGAPPLRPCIELEAAVAAGAARLTCASDKKTSRARDALTGLVSRGVLGLNEGWLWTV